MNWVSLTWKRLSLLLPKVCIAVMSGTKLISFASVGGDH